MSDTETISGILRNISLDISLRTDTWRKKKKKTRYFRYYFPGGLDVEKRAICCLGRFDPWIGRFPGKGNGYNSSHLPGESMDRKESLAGYSPLDLQRVRHDLNAELL